MMPGMNPRQMQDMMRKLGMQQTSVDAESVIIRTKDKDIIIENPEVAKVTMMGQQTWQITGAAREQQGARARVRHRARRPRRARRP